MRCPPHSATMRLRQGGQIPATEMSMTTTGFHYQDDQLCVDGVPLDGIARQHGTPAYVYSWNLLRENYRRIADAFPGIDSKIAYSVKSNSNLAVLQLLAREGACFDIVSGGELERVLRVGVPGGRIIFAGVGKTESEMRAALEAGVSEFNVESESEAERLNRIAGDMGRRAPVAIRINPNVDAKTHKYITTGKEENKFGISLQRALELARRFARELDNLDLVGLHCHIGSQILDPSVHPKTVLIVSEFARSVMDETGIQLKTINFGGGFGIAYQEGQEPLDIGPFAKAVSKAAEDLGVTLIVEPGRSIAGPAGALLTRVEYMKAGDAKNFVIVDAAMTELMRPTLYEAYHRILPIEKSEGGENVADVVGPVCETGDFLALDRKMAIPKEGDLLAFMDAGAYGFVMASHYNTRPSPPEILVKDGKQYIIRERESYDDLLAHERTLD